MGFVSNSRGIESCVSGTSSFVGQSDSYVSDLGQGEVPSSVGRSSISITGEISWKPEKLGYGNKHPKGPVWWSDRFVGLRFEMGNRKVTVQNREIYHRSHSPSFLGNQEETRIKPWCRPFGLAVAPQVFTRVFQTVIAHLHTLSIQAHSYLDDSLLKEFDSEILSRHTFLFIRLLLELGFLISWKKTEYAGEL
jgi:hypothetical protein